MNNHCISTNLGLILLLQPLFSLTFHFIHLSSELYFFSHLCFNNTTIFYLDSKILQLPSSFLIHIPCEMSTQPVSFKIFFTKFNFYQYLFPPSEYHVISSSSSSSYCPHYNLPWSPKQTYFPLFSNTEEHEGIGFRVKIICADRFGSWVCSFTLKTV